MNENAFQPWWVLIFRGVALIAFGAVALILPGITLVVLMALFATYALIGGAAAVFGSVANRREKLDWGAPLMLGLFSIGTGAIAFLHPGLTALILVLLIAAHALIVGALDIITAARMHGDQQHEDQGGQAG
ncbi:MAG TPA: DUF308 domain-containing protein, partial [Noviherbaspirillum sp.]|nr:DUF308 domain-containing protein [Noviherbaspirillum sp.]